MRLQPSPIVQALRALLVTIGTLFPLSGCVTTQDQRFDFTRVVMGVQARITLYAPAESKAQSAAAAAFATLADVEVQTSDYRVDNALTHLAKHAGTGQWTPIGPHLQHMLDTSILLARQSGGIFDPTMGPLTHLWRTQRQHPPSLLSEREITAARQLVNWRRIDLAPGQARLLDQGMKLDFGAIAKGYAAECAVRTLEHQGTPRCLVSIAGDIFAGDPPPGSLGWRVVIQSGQAAESTPAHADDWLTLHQAGCSTSGDVEQVITAGGKRQSHIIDIRTGFGSDRRRSVTVVAPRGWQSDALATTLYLLDDDAAQRLLNLYPGTHAIIFDRVQADDQDDGNAHIRRREMSSAAVRISAIR